MRSLKTLWVGAMALTAACVGGPDEGASSSAVTTPLGIGAIPSLYGTQAAACPQGSRVAIVVAFDHPGAVADLATALNRAGRNPVSINRFNSQGLTSPLPSAEPSNRNGAWKRVVRIASQLGAVMSQGCAVDLFEASTDTQSALAAAADAARNSGDKVVNNPFGFDESSLITGFKTHFQPAFAGQGIFAPAVKSGSTLQAPGIFGGLYAIGTHTLDSFGAPTGMLGAIGGTSTVEAAPAYQTFGSMRTLPDASTYGDLTEIVVDGVVTTQTGPIVATSVAVGLAALSTSVDPAHAWGGLMTDITTGPGALAGFDIATGNGFPLGTNKL